MKKISSIIMVFIILGAFLTFLNPLSAGTIHVYPEDDIVAKIGTAASGDTVYVHSGTYDISGYLGGILILNPNVTILGDSSSNTIIDGGGVSTQCISCNLNNVTIKNLSIRNFLTYGILGNSNNGTIENCTFNSTGTSFHGIYVNGDYWTIKNVSMSGNKFDSGVTFHGIWGGGSNWIVDGFDINRNEVKVGANFFPIIASGNNWIIQNGIVDNNIIATGSFFGIINTGSNILTKNCSVSGNNVTGACTFYGILTNGFDLPLINCTVSKNFVDSETMYGMMCTGDSLSVKNCICTGNTNGDSTGSVYGIVVDGGGIQNSIKYSNSWDNKDNWGQTLGGLEPGEGCISVDPIFTKGFLGDFYLSNSSSCVDSGSESSAALGLYKGFTTRADGRWDTGTIDMGFHYASNRGPPSSLPMDKILKIVKENQED
jgi:hypothetical protein